MPALRRSIPRVKKWKQTNKQASKKATIVKEPRGRRMSVSGDQGDSMGRALFFSLSLNEIGKCRRGTFIGNKIISKRFISIMGVEYGEQKRTGGGARMWLSMWLSGRPLA